jgi:hypothetical protein
MRGSCSEVHSRVVVCAVFVRRTRTIVVFGAQREGHVASITVQYDRLKVDAARGATVTAVYVSCRTMNFSTNQLSGSIPSMLGSITALQ